MKRRVLLALVVVVAAALPLAVHAPDARASATNTLLLLLAAVGLNIAAGYAGQPSLGQGAFVGLGAYGTAVLRVHAGWGLAASTVTAVGIAAVAGVVVARAVSSLRAPFVALTTWLVAWAFALAVAAFPALSGGARGIVLPPARVRMRALGVAFGVGPAALYELALVALVVCAVLTWFGLARFGAPLAAIREDPAAAAAAGIEVARFRAGASVATATIGGIAGALLVQVAGVADPTAYAPLLSLKLFLVVLVGGAGTFAGPVVGLAALGAIARIADAAASRAGIDSARAEAIGAAILVLGVVSVARRGIVPMLRDRFPRPARSEDGIQPLAPAFEPGASLSVRDLTVTFGGIRALDGLSFAVGRGTIHAIVGPNGSGKTTVLRVLAGALPAPAAGIALDGVAPVRGDIARTLQMPGLAEDLTAEQHVLSGMEPRRRPALLGSITNAPHARAAQRHAVARARGLLAFAGVDRTARARELTVAEQRFVQIARALASSPRVLLLDEPSAGMDAHAEARLGEMLRAVRAHGTTVVVVEHNIPLVRALADRVSVLDAGVCIAEGTPAEVALDPRVRAAYLGSE